jgi:Flp pilus assembly protein TadD
MVMNNLASVLDQGGDVNAAEEILRRRVAIVRENAPARHWRLGAALGALGAHLLRFRGDPGAALGPMRERLTVYRGALGDEHDWTAEARLGVGECLLRLDRFEEAEPLLLEGRAQLEQVEGRGGQRTRDAGALLVELYERWDRPDRAAPYRESGGSP